MCIELETLVQLKNLLMNVHLVFDSIFEFKHLSFRRLLPVEEDEADFKICALLGQFFNGIAPIIQLTVNSRISDRGSTTCGDRISWVIAEYLCLCVECLDIKELLAVVSYKNWNFVLFFFDVQGDELVTLGSLRLERSSSGHFQLHV